MPLITTLAGASARGYGGLVTFGASTSFESIATANGNGVATSFTFSSIPSTFQHLQLRGILRDNSGGFSSGNINIQFNASGSKVGTSHSLTGFSDGGTVSAGGDTGEMRINYASIGSAVTANIYGAFIMDVLDYKSTSKNKVIRTFAGQNANNNVNATQTVALVSNMWIDTAAITEIKIVHDGGRAFASGSTVALYGIKGA